MMPQLRSAGDSPEVETALRDFNESCITLASLLQGGANLTDLDRLSIENHLAIVQLNYSVWVRKSQVVHPPKKPRLGSL